MGDREKLEHRLSVPLSFRGYVSIWIAGVVLVTVPGSFTGMILLSFRNYHDSWYQINVIYLYFPELCNSSSEEFSLQLNI